MKDAPQLLTSTEAAEYLGASPTSVKRWADEGRLRCVKTVGRHRRFAKTDLDRFLLDQMGAEPGAEGIVGPDTADAWLEDLVTGRPYRVQARLFDARSELGSWAAVCDRIGEVATALGEAWARGALSVVDEHLASERLERALARVAESLPLPRDAPRALLATPQDEEHTLGLALAELALRELGWQPVWAGRRTPLDRLSEALAAHDIALMAVSASSHAADPDAMEQIARALGDACRPRGVRLLLGGRGAWPDPPPYGARLHDFRSLSYAAQPP